MQQETTARVRNVRGVDSKAKTGSVRRRCTAGSVLRRPERSASERRTTTSADDDDARQRTTRCHCGPRTVASYARRTIAAERSARRRDQQGRRASRAGAGAARRDQPSCRPRIVARGAAFGFSTQASAAYARSRREGKQVLSVSSLSEGLHHGQRPQVSLAALRRHR